VGSIGGRHCNSCGGFDDLAKTMHLKKNAPEKFGHRLALQLLLATCTILPLDRASADIGVAEPNWTSPPLRFEAPHRVSLPEPDDVADTVSIGNFEKDKATVDITFVGNGMRFYGGQGEARRVKRGVYEFPSDHNEHCTLTIRLEKTKIGIKGTADPYFGTDFCPSETLWLPAKR
jgi:hypothetical protein